jgi:hypothetical protein
VLDTPIFILTNLASALLSHTQAKQDNYKSAMADTAATSAANVDILEITESLSSSLSGRRAGSVDVATKVKKERVPARETGGSEGGREVSTQ